MLYLGLVVVEDGEVYVSDDDRLWQLSLRLGHVESVAFAAARRRTGRGQTLLPENRKKFLAGNLKFDSKIGGRKF